MVKKMDVMGSEITVTSQNGQDYICLTDMVKAKDGEFFISDWLRNRNTIEFLGILETVYNTACNHGEFATIKTQAGLNSYRLSVKEWTQKTRAIGLQAAAGRYGGTYAHRDIAFEFGMWISPKFKIYLIKEFQRLKDDESRAASLEWNFQRTLSKVNYKRAFGWFKSFKKNYSPSAKSLRSCPINSAATPLSSALANLEYLCSRVTSWA